MTFLITGILKMSRYSEKEQVLILKLFEYFQKEKDAGHTLLPLTAVYDVSNKARLVIYSIYVIRITRIRPLPEILTHNALWI